MQKINLDDPISKLPVVFNTTISQIEKTTNEIRDEIKIEASKTAYNLSLSEQNIFMNLEIIEDQIDKRTKTLERNVNEQIMLLKITNIFLFLAGIIVVLG